MKQGIIIVNKGTMDKEVRRRCIEDFMFSVGDRIPDADMVCVYTDDGIRKRLREETGEKYQNLKAAILSMKDRGVTDLTVVPTEIHDGPEFKKMKEEVTGLASIFKTVNISKPLLYDEADYEITARAMHGAFRETVKDDILVLITAGHKTDAVEELKAFETHLAKYFNECYVATLYGERKLYKIIKDINVANASSRRIVFIPMEFIAGETVENDVSQEYTSLVLRLEEEGYAVDSIFKGLAEYDDFQRLYMRHLYDALR